MLTYLTAVGGGTFPTLTGEALRVLMQADVIYGWERTLEDLPEDVTERRYPVKNSAELFEMLRKDEAAREPSVETAVVVYSGDTGFYSGARILLPKLKEAGMKAELIPGVSSIQIFAARLGRPWQDWNLVSAHGVACDPVLEVMKGKTTCFLTGGKVGPKDLCRQLSEAGLGNLSAVLAEDLTYETENLSFGTVRALAERDTKALNLLLVDPAPMLPVRSPGYPDSSFERGKVPMTKREVRAAALAKLAVAPTDTVWDIGAGTGSVSVELALAAREGRAYAIEYDPEAVVLARRNRERFCAWNLTVEEGSAPEGLSAWPTPDAVFIGGSRGNLTEILDAVLKANPKARVCVTAITLETLSGAVVALKAHGIEASVTQLAAARTSAVGTHHMLKAENPVFLITGNCDE